MPDGVEVAAGVFDSERWRSATFSFTAESEMRLDCSTHSRAGLAPRVLVTGTVCVVVVEAVLGLLMMSGCLAVSSGSTSVKLKLDCFAVCSGPSCKLSWVLLEQCGCYNVSGN